VRVIGLAAITLLAGCAPRPVIVEPETLEPSIAASGASLYLLETRDDWLNDVDVNIVGGLPVGGFASEANANIRMSQPFEPQGGTCQPFTDFLWTGEQGLLVLLRYARSKAGNLLVSQADFRLVSGSPVEITLYNLNTGIENDKNLENRVAFRVRLTATPAKNPNYCVLKLNAEKRADGVAQSIAEESLTLCFGSTILIHHRKNSHRFHVLMLHIASLDSGK